MVAAIRDWTPQALDALFGVVQDATANPQARRKAALKIAEFLLPKAGKKAKVIPDEYGFSINPNLASAYRDIQLKLRALQSTRKIPAIAEKIKKLEPKHHALIFRVNNDHDAASFREHLLQILQSLLIRLGRKKSQAGGIPTRVCKTLDQSSPYWIRRDGNNNWNCISCFFGGLGRRRVHRDDDIYIKSNKLGSERKETIKLTACVSILDADALSFDPSKVAETLAEGIYLS